MKKTGILTYHTGYNYGASLQAYALQTVIRNMGIDCEIIHFETEGFVASREMFSRNPKRIKEVIKIATRLPYYKPLKKRQYLFDEFTENYMKLSPKCQTEQEVIEHAEEYDCIVCGSDQIWNLSKADAPAANMLFFLNFSKKQRRVSYAASMGKWVDEAHQYEADFLPWLKKFDAISVRENSGVDYIRSLGLECELTLDPTVLLDKEDYDIICAPRQIPEPYVLLFSWSCSEETMITAKKVGIELNLPVYNIVPPPRAIGKGFMRKLDIGPCEFLSMIKYADFVVTDSFHGTAFSTTFEKPYVSVVTGSPDPRMESFLDSLGLANHLVTSKEVNVADMLATDYSDVQNKKKDLRKSSFAFLKRALEKKYD